MRSNSYKTRSPLLPRSRQNFSALLYSEKYYYRLLHKLVQYLQEGLTIFNGTFYYEERMYTSVELWKIYYLPIGH